MVNRAGLEPATLCLEGRCSIRLSYRSNMCAAIVANSTVPLDYIAALPFCC